MGIQTVVFMFIFGVNIKMIPEKIEMIKVNLYFYILKINMVDEEKKR